MAQATQSQHSPQFDVFLCHNSEDKPTVKQIGEQLKCHGLRPWLDEWDLRPGLPGQRAFEEQIKSIRAGAVFVGDAGIGPWQDLEQEAFLRQFVKRKCPVIPVILPNCRRAPKLPVFLEGMTWVDFRKSDPDPLKRLMWGITGARPDSLTPPTAAISSTPPGAQDILPVFDVPYRENPYFTGRRQVLSRLRTALTRNRKAVLGQAISGLGGIGKTQTAVAYAYRHRKKYKVVFWLRAADELELTTGFINIAKRLALPHDERQPDETVGVVKRWLASNTDWLLVFDNADQPELLKKFLPTSAPGHILITSRSRAFDALGIAEPFNLPPLANDEAVSFLVDRTGRKNASPTEREQAEKLATELGGLPLALEQAGAYIRTMQVSFAAYRKHRTELLHKQKPIVGDYPESVATTWAVNFAEVKKASQASEDLLSFTAFLSPDDIPFELVTKGASELGTVLGDLLTEADGDSPALYETLEPLSRFALVDIDREGKTYSIHRLVQEVLKDNMDSDNRRVWAERSVRAVSEAFPEVEYAIWPLCERLVAHARVASQIVEQYELELQQAARLFDETAAYLYYSGQYSEAEPLSRQALEIRRTALGEDHPDFATNLNNLAGLYHSQGRYAEAEPLCHQALDVHRTALGEDHPDFAASLNNLAELYSSQGRYEKAEPLHRQALEIRRTVLGEDHLDFAMSLNNVAGLYRSQGRYEEAEPLYRQALEIRRTALGEDHPNFATSLNNLARLYNSQGRYAKAEPLYHQALEIRRTALGEDHPNFAASLNNLGGLYVSQSRYEEAEPLFLQGLEIARTALGEDHLNFAMSLNNVAELYGSQGRYMEAEPLYCHALEIRRTALGEDHPDFARSLNNLALLYGSQGRYLEAEPLYRQALKILRTALGERHPEVSTVTKNYAVLLREMGRESEAEAIEASAQARPGTSPPTS